MTNPNARIEERLKQIIGEQTVMVVVLQSKIEELTAELLKAKPEVAEKKK